MQHINQPLDGDMAWNLIPAGDVKPILEDPLGIKAIANDRTYANPNRFFSHWIYREYLTAAPLVLQKFVAPISSVYLSCGIAKTLIQVLLIGLLAIVVSGTKNVLRMDFIIAAVLVTPLFQTNGYRSYMGIIDPSTTYSFFYALPCAILLLYLTPFIKRHYHGLRSGTPLCIKLLWIPLAFVVCLSGPLNPGVVLIFCILVIGSHVANNYAFSKQIEIMGKMGYVFKMIPKNYWFFLLPVGLLSLYSLFLGSYNSITIATQIPLAELYAKLPEGIYYQFTQKLGFPILFIILILNSILINRKFKTEEGKKILNIFKWVGIFALCYILLLPLGGYRVYRSYVLRYDTIMPITLSLIFIFGATTLYLIKNMSKKQKTWYLPIIAIVLFIFTFADEPEFDNNDCERSALTEISSSKETVVALEQDCSVVEWIKLDAPENSELNAQLLTKWRITKEDKLYYNK